MSKKKSLLVSALFLLMIIIITLAASMLAKVVFTVIIVLFASIGLSTCIVAFYLWLQYPSEDETAEIDRAEGEDA